MRVSDIMTRYVYTVRPDDPVERAARLLADHGIAAVPVLDLAGHLVGMVGENDLLGHRVGTWPGPVPEEEGTATQTVAEVTNKDPVTAAPDDDVAEVTALMLDRGVGSVPVVEDGSLVGIVSRRDVLRAVVRGNDVIRQQVQQRLDRYGGRGRWEVTVTDGDATIGGTFTDDEQRTAVLVLARTVPGVRAAHTG